METVTPWLVYAGECIYQTNQYFSTCNWCDVTIFQLLFRKITMTDYCAKVSDNWKSEALTACTYIVVVCNKMVSYEILTPSHHLFCSSTYSPVHRQITASMASSIICLVTPPPWKSRSLKFTIVNSLNDKQYLYVQLYFITLKDYIVTLLIIIAFNTPNYWIPYIRGLSEKFETIAFLSF